jgi:hypothetical protein
LANPSEPFVDGLRDTYGRLSFTHKTQEKMAEIESRREIVFKIANLIVIVLTLAAVIADLASNDDEPLSVAIKAFTIAAASIALIFAFVQLNFEPGKQAEKYRTSAKLFLGLRDQYGSLIADASSGVPVGELRARRDALEERMRQIDENAPQTTAKAYSKACEAIANSEGITLSDEDIRRIFPETLRRPQRDAGQEGPSRSRGFKWPFR